MVLQMDRTTDHPDIVAIGASAGGLVAIEALLTRLPPSLPAAVLIVLHRPVNQASHLQEILQRLWSGPVAVARDGETLQHGTCYVGMPDRHLTVGPNSTIQLLPDHFYRMHNIDTLFQSLARNAGRRTIGVVLSGLLKDGTLGLKAIKEAGGVTLVQDPAEAEFADMPRNAIEYDGRIDYVGSIENIAAEIRRRCSVVSP
jgi:two-component system chemotaxis response regulator CheB